MRDMLNKLMTGTMVAGAALLVVACGGSETASTDNTSMTEMNATDPMMEGTTNDTAATDMMDANMAMDANMTMDANVSTDANMAMENTTNAM